MPPLTVTGPLEPPHDTRGGAQLQHAAVDRRACSTIGRATEGLRAGAVLDQRDISTTNDVSETFRSVVLADV